jgi:hypothetical protein
MEGTDRGQPRLGRRNALKALTLSAAALAGGAGVADVMAATTPAPPSHPDAGLTPAPKGARPATGTPPIFGITYQMFAGTDFHTRQGAASTFNGNTGLTTSGDYFVMPVNLPKGAVVTECECYFLNNAGGSTYFLEMQVTDPSNNARNVNNIASTAIHSAGPQLLRIAPIVAPGSDPFDPSRYGIQILAGSDTAGAYLYGARIGYNVLPGQVTMLPAPIRLLESRPAYQDPSPDQTHPGRPINTGETWIIPITGRVVGGGPIPIGAKAVIGNVTVTNPVSGGYLTVFPEGPLTPPPTSSINYGGPGTTIANGVIVGLSMAGRLSIYASAQTDVIFDAAGYIM